MVKMQNGGAMTTVYLMVQMMKLVVPLIGTEKQIIIMFLL